MRNLGILLGGAIALAACSTTPPPGPPVDLSNPLMAPGYLAQAASSDQFEVQSGQLALQASQNPSVHQFANMIIRDHTNSTQMLMSAASAARVPPPPPGLLLPAQQAMLDQLRAAGSGYGFDRTFQQIQIMAHQQALALHQNYATNGDVPALRATATEIVPVVENHLAMAQALQAAPPPPPPPPAPMPAPAPGRVGERG